MALTLAAAANSLPTFPDGERAVTASRLEELDVDVLGALIGAVDDRLEHTGDEDLAARLGRGRARLELALSRRLAQ